MFIFCDESDYSGYRLLGTIWLSEAALLDFENKILQLRTRIGFWEEVKSNDLNATCLQERIDFYEEFLKIGLAIPDLKVGLIRYHTDPRLTRHFFKGGVDQRDFSFLKLLITQRCPLFLPKGVNDIHVLHDHKQMSTAARAMHVGGTFKQLLAQRTGKNIPWSRPADSKICSALQLVDLITGMTRYRLQYKTDPVPNANKAKMIDLMEKKFKRMLHYPSLPSASPFNLFLHRPNLAKLISAGVSGGTP